MNKYCILGSDERTTYLRKFLKEEKRKIVNLIDANIVIAPIPFTKDGIKITGEIITCKELVEQLQLKDDVVLISGAIPKEIKRELDNKKIAYFDIMENDSMAINNAIPTAEGAINVAINNTKFTIHGSNVLILGFGRIGKVLAKMLQGIGANVYCEARKKSDIALINALGYKAVHLSKLDEFIPAMDIIFNTIPSLILDKNRIYLVNKDTLIVDLASAPGGIDLIAAKEKGIHTEWSLALPAKVAPYTAAKYIKEEIDTIVN